jgi:hypothetical protein
MGLAGDGQSRAQYQSSTCKGVQASLASLASQPDECLDRRRPQLRAEPYRRVDALHTVGDSQI